MRHVEQHSFFTHDNQALHYRYWAATRSALAYGAQFSEGLRLGQEVGFDSGSTLDYVYRNQARGSHELGKKMDKHYLNAIGWRGIRQRKLHLEELLKHAITQLLQINKAVHIVDIAAGLGSSRGCGRLFNLHQSALASAINVYCSRTH